MSVARDDAIIEDLAARLEAAGEFDPVLVNASPDRREAAAEHSGKAVAWIRRVRFAEVPVEGTGDSRDHTTYFRIWIEVREEDDTQALRLLARAEAVAMRAVQRQRVGGVCMPAFTLLDAGADDWSAAHPGRRVALDGSCRCRLSVAGRDVSDRTT